MQYMYYCEVTDDMKVGPGGGCPEEGELIEVVEIPVSEGKALMWNESINRPLGFMFGIMWFYDNIYNKK